MSPRPLLLVPILLAAAAPDEASAPASPDANELPPSISAQCDETPNASSLVHLRCGDSRLLVAQLQRVGSPVHDELLESLLDLVPGPTERIDRTSDDLLHSEIIQQRADLDRGELSVVLILTSRRSSGRSAACLFGVDGRRSKDRSERAWCDEATAALLPPPPAAPPATRIEVEGPEHGLEDLAGP